MSYKGGCCYFCYLPEDELKALVDIEDPETGLTEFDRHMSAQCMIDPKTPREKRIAADHEAAVRDWRGDRE